MGRFWEDNQLSDVTRHVFLNATRLSIFNTSRTCAHTCLRTRNDGGGSSKVRLPALGHRAQGASPAAPNITLQIPRAEHLCWGRV